MVGDSPTGEVVASGVEGRQSESQSAVGLDVAVPRDFTEAVNGPGSNSWSASVSL